MLALTLDAGEVVIAEAGTMVARDAGVRIQVALDVGGSPGLWASFKALLTAVVRKLVGGEHLLVNRFTAPATGGWVWIAPAFAGEMRALEVAEGATWTLAPGAFLASAPGVHLVAQWAGWGALFSRDAAFWLALRGAGEVWVAGRGALDRIDVDGVHVVDAGHLVAFSAGLTARVRGAGPQVGRASREGGPTVELSGRGHVLVQARGTGALIDFLTPLLPE